MSTANIVRVVWKEASRLATEDPPRWTASCKKFLASLYTGNPSVANEPSNARPVVFVRAREFALPKTYIHSEATTQTHVDIKPGVYDYKSVPPRDHITDPSKYLDWHVNFADKHLFGYYGGGLFAQDEMQAAEMPILGSVREALVRMTRGKKSTPKELLPEPLTRDHDNLPTPCIVRGAERRVIVAVDKNKEAGRPNGLYGNAFRAAGEEAIRNATTILPRGDTFVNLIAMDAPKGSGTYSFATIKEVLGTAYTGFTLAKNESRSGMAADGSPDGEQLMTTIHTGHWGTGAYGGNKVLMAMLQILAARLAGVDKLVYHSFDQTAPVQEALHILDNEIITKNDIQSEVSVGKLIDRIEAKKFRWGVSDGN